VTAAASSSSSSSSGGGGGGGGALDWRVLLGLALIALISRALRPYIKCSAAT
jgi:hypothetical protein